MATITFHGAARTVTGSKHLVETGASRVLVDCGLFQGLKELRLRNWDACPFDPESLDAVVLTHAHLDHVGYLPKIVREGYRGPIHCTPATAKIARLILLDSASLQERDARYANKKGFSKHKPALPLYTEEDATRAINMLRPLPRGEWFEPAAKVRMRFQDAGHLLGSNAIESEIESTRVVFSGDIGKYDSPLYHDPKPPPACDIVVCESTYGNREHSEEPVLEQVARLMETAIARGGVVVMASFAVGRAQQLTYLLQVLIREKRIPPLPIYIDSPMAVRATHIFREYREDHDLTEGMLDERDGVLDGPRVHLCRTSDESREINRVRGPAVIISSAGMMTGGRILFHLRQRLPHAENTILLGGYMAPGTRGRRLQDGERTLKIHGREVEVRAHVDRISALSGHAGRSGLLRWLAPLSPKQCVLTHGEVDSAEALAATLREDRGWDVMIPGLGESVSF